MRDQALAVVAAAYPAAITGREVAASLPATRPCGHGSLRNPTDCRSCGGTMRRRPTEQEAWRYLSALERQGRILGHRSDGMTWVLWRWVKTEADELEAWWDHLAAQAPEDP